MSQTPGSDEFVGTGPWMTVVNPDVFMTFCSVCGEHFKKGSKVQRIEGGYGYQCDRHRPAVS